MKSIIEALLGCLAINVWMMYSIMNPDKFTSGTSSLTRTQFVALMTVVLVVGDYYLISAFVGMISR